MDLHLKSMKRMNLLFLLICFSLFGQAQINLNEVYNNNGSYALVVKFNTERNQWDWISLDYLAETPELGSSSSNLCDLLVGGFEQPKSEEAINTALQRIQEGECKVLIRYDYHNDTGPRRTICLKFSGIVSPEKIDFIQNELYKSPFGDSSK